MSKDRHCRELTNAIRASDCQSVERLLKSGQISPELATRALTKHAAVAVRGDGASSAANMVRLLLQHGANANQKLSYGMTTLHHAAKTATSSAGAAAVVVRVLLQEGRADPNVQDDDGHTPLHMASVRNNVPVGKVLLEHGGADMMMIPDASGWTVLETSLFSSTADCRYHRGQEESCGFLRMLLEHGGNANYCNQQGNSLLHIAAAKGRSEAIQVLLEFGANPNTANRDGKIPLELACENGFTSCILVLLQRMNADGSIHLLKRKDATK